MFVYFHMGPLPKRVISWSVYYETQFQSSTRWPLPVGVQGMELKTVHEYLTRAMTITDTLRRAAAAGRGPPVDARGHFDISAFERTVSFFAKDERRHSASDSCDEFSTDEEEGLGVAGAASVTGGRFRPFVQLGGRFEPKQANTLPIPIPVSQPSTMVGKRQRVVRYAHPHFGATGHISATCGVGRKHQHQHQHLQTKPTSGNDGALPAGVSAAAAAAGMGMNMGGMAMGMGVVPSANPLIKQAEYALSMHGSRVAQLQHQHHQRQHEQQHQHHYGTTSGHGPNAPLPTVPLPLRNEVTLDDDANEHAATASEIEAIAQQLVGQVEGVTICTITICIITICTISSSSITICIRHDMVISGICVTSGLNSVPICGTSSHPDLSSSLCIYRQAVMVFCEPPHTDSAPTTPGPNLLAHDVTPVENKVTSTALDHTH